MLVKSSHEVRDHCHSKMKKKSVNDYVNPFHATVLFRYPLKASENLWFSDVFKGYRKRPVAQNRLIYF